ncbi:class I SAM-dependent methyltransferase [Mesorhizobium marinum]|uniref:Class I SAM-dependent methyltransferase n=1 Tax=Mesorhizobium marinum TaxID=3228790 RepID=A0ABV3R3B3_9HYPH
MRTDTAHRKWNETWQSEDGRRDWSQADPQVLACSAAVLSSGRSDALDLGCGVGRHALALARMGFNVDALDGSEAGIAQLRRDAALERLPIQANQGSMSELPFAGDSFDYLLAFNVIYHGDPEVLAATLAEIARVLRPGGTLQLTMLSKRNVNFGVGDEIAKDTFVVPDAADDKVHPHFYCNAAELVGLLAGFELKSLADIEQKPGHWHWHAVAERL